MPLNTSSIFVISASTVYVILFLSIVLIGGLPEAKLFLQQSFSVLSGFGNTVALMVSELGQSWTPRMTEIIGALVVVKLPMSLAQVFVAIVEKLATNISLFGFLSSTIVLTVIAGFIFDQSALRIMGNVFDPIQMALVAVWKVISDPQKLVSYALFYAIVTTVAILKGQKLS